MWIKILIAIFLLASPVWATIDSTNGTDGDFWSTAVWTSGTKPAAGDSLIIRNGDSLYITSTHDSVVTLIFIREGGVLDMNGAGAHLQTAGVALGYWSGGEAPFFGTGGRFRMGADDTLGLWDSDAFIVEEDFYAYGDNALVDINGGSSSTPAVIYTAGGDGKAHIEFYLAGPEVNFQYARFNNLLEASTRWGIIFDQGARVAADQKIEYCVFDSCNMRFTGGSVTGENIKNCTFNCNYNYATNWSGWSSAFGYSGGHSDTLQNCNFNYDQQNTATTGTYDAISINSDSVAILACSVTTTNINSGDQEYRGDYAIALGTNKTGTDIIDTYIYGFHFGIDGADNHDSVFIDNSRVLAFSHEAVIWHADCVNWTFQASLFDPQEITPYRGTLIGYDPNGGYNNFHFYYNTIVTNTGDAYAPISYDYLAVPTPGIDITDHDMVGNILVGRVGTDSADIYVRDSIEVELDTVLSNAMDSIYVGTNSAWTLSEYDWKDSNEVTSNFGFVDSVNYDWRLATGSSMLNAAESTFYVRVFEPTDSTDAPGNIGYYQGAGVGGAPEAYEGQMIIIGGQ